MSEKYYCANLLHYLARSDGINHRQPYVYLCHYYLGLGTHRFGNRIGFGGFLFFRAKHLERSIGWGDS